MRNIVFYSLFEIIIKSGNFSIFLLFTREWARVSWNYLSILIGGLGNHISLSFVNFDECFVEFSIEKLTQLAFKVKFQHFYYLTFPNNFKKVLPQYFIAPALLKCRNMQIMQKRFFPKFYKFKVLVNTSVRGYERLWGKDKKRAITVLSFFWVLLCFFLKKILT